MNKQEHQPLQVLFDSFRELFFQILIQTLVLTHLLVPHQNQALKHNIKEQKKEQTVQRLQRMESNLLKSEIPFRRGNRSRGKSLQKNKLSL